MWSNTAADNINQWLNGFTIPKTWEGTRKILMNLFFLPGLLQQVNQLMDHQEERIEDPETWNSQAVS